MATLSSSFCNQLRDLLYSSLQLLTKISNDKKKSHITKKNTTIRQPNTIILEELTTIIRLIGLDLENQFRIQQMAYTSFNLWENKKTF